MGADIAIFDAHLHAESLPDEDLRTLALFGVKGALLPAHDAVEVATSESLLQHFEDLAKQQARRLWGFGIRPFVALGVHPAKIPWHGLDAVLGQLPHYFGTGCVVALGEIGLEVGGPREEQVFARQLELAKELSLQVLVHTPEREKLKVTRRVLAMLRESEIEPARVLVDHAAESTLRPIRECGYFAGLSIHPGRLGAEAAVTLVSRHGSEGLVMSSDAGAGSGDLLALPRIAGLLKEAQLSDVIIRRVLSENALQFYRLERGALSEG